METGTAGPKPPSVFVNWVAILLPALVSPPSFSVLGRGQCSHADADQRLPRETWSRPCLSRLPGHLDGPSVVPPTSSPRVPRAKPTTKV